MRVAAIAVMALLVAATACGRELPRLTASVKSLTPAGSRPAGECSGNEAFIESAWAKCIVVMRGTPRSAIAPVARWLRARGFRIGCEATFGELEVVAVRGTTSIAASARRGAITFDPADGKPLDVVDARFVPPGSRRIPAGSVGLKIDIDKLNSSSSDSYPLPLGDCPN